VLRGWNVENNQAFFDDAKDHCEELKKISNFSPFELEREQKEELAEAIELGLRNVPISDFCEIYQQREDYIIMGIKDKGSRLRRFGESYFNRAVDVEFNLIHGLDVDPEEIRKKYFSIS